MGSYVGSETIARIWPVLGSSATTAPWTPCAEALQARRTRPSARRGSMVSWTLPPLGAELLSRSTRRVTNSRESSPDSTSFWVCSIPVWLK